MTAPKQAPTFLQSRDAVTRQLGELFGVRGFEGVSIGDISQATGLGRSSLYHYFPGGKTEMAQQVLSQIRAALAEVIFQHLSQVAPIEAKIDAMLAAISQIYQGGKVPCVVASLISTSNVVDVSKEGSAILADWSTAIAEALTRAGLKGGEERALEALSVIQGALIVARATGSNQAFDLALRRARGLLLN